MGSQLIAVIGIGGGKGINRLARLFDGINAIPNRGKARLPAAHEAFHVQHDDFYALVTLGKLQRADDIALTDFANRRSLRGERR